MGLDLMLLPLDFDGLAYEDNPDYLKDWGYSHTVLTLPRHTKIFDALQRAAEGRGTAPPTAFTCYVAQRADGEPGYGPLTEDAYGVRLRCLEARTIGEILCKHRPDVPRLRAIAAYLCALEPTNRVVLYWH